MHAAADDSSPHNDSGPSNNSGPSNDWPGDAEIEARQPRNLLLLAIHQIVFRLGWIFKTESVIMPAFIDAVAGAGWLRGCLPLLNRIGQSVPPVLCAEHLRASPRKKRPLAVFTVLMSLPFSLLATACFLAPARRNAWMPLLFLTLYLTFFVINGLYRMSFGTVQGKLIRPTRRGYLLLVSSFWGSIPAMVFAWWLLPGWLEEGLAGQSLVGFGRTFSFTAVCFLASAVAILLLYEPRDAAEPPRGHLLAGLAETWETLRRDANLRILIVSGMLYGASLIVSPHYQAFAREELGASGGSLMVWVIVQNAAVGIFSLGVGPLADALGNRLTMRTLIFASALSPLFVAVLSCFDHWGPSLFWMVFIPLGASPLVMRIMVNYTLETCDRSDHPRYLSTLALCLALPFAVSPAVGWLVDVAGFRAVFFAAAGLIVSGGCVTFLLDEPRHRVISREMGAVGIGAEE